MIIITSQNASDIAEFLFGPPQQDVHCQGWRWHRYIADTELNLRSQAVAAEADRIVARARTLLRRAPVREAAE
jgi:hypothetical protein